MSAAFLVAALLATSPPRDGAGSHTRGRNRDVGLRSDLDPRPRWAGLPLLPVWAVPDPNGRPASDRERRSSRGPTKRVRVHAAGRARRRHRRSSSYRRRLVGKSISREAARGHSTRPLLLPLPRANLGANAASRGGRHVRERVRLHFPAGREDRRFHSVRGRSVLHRGPRLDGGRCREDRKPQDGRPRPPPPPRPAGRRPLLLPRLQRQQEVHHGQSQVPKGSSWSRA